MESPTIMIDIMTLLRVISNQRFLDTLERSLINLGNPRFRLLKMKSLTGCQNQ